jgi:hypothetical protein
MDGCESLYIVEGSRCLLEERGSEFGVVIDFACARTVDDGREAGCKDEELGGAG